MKTKKIESKGSQVFNVPNDEEGQTFLKSASKYLNRTIYKASKRGRGSRKEHGNASDIPVEHAEWIALYLNGSEVNRIQLANWERENSMRHQLIEERKEEKARGDKLERVAADLRAEVTRLKKTNHELELAAKRTRMQRLTAENLAAYREQNKPTRIKTVKFFGFDVKAKVEGDTLVIG